MVDNGVFKPFEIYRFQKILHPWWTMVFLSHLRYTDFKRFSIHGGQWCFKPFEIYRFQKILHPWWTMVFLSHLRAIYRFQKILHPWWTMVFLSHLRYTDFIWDKDSPSMVDNGVFKPFEIYRFQKILHPWWTMVFLSHLRYTDFKRFSIHGGQWCF